MCCCLWPDGPDICQVAVTRPLLLHNIFLDVTLLLLLYCVLLLMFT
jgi:hypothetical protein